MSLYTQLDSSSIQKITQQYKIAAIKKWAILKGGAENTNCFIETRDKKYVLTICERKTVEETTILANLLRHLEKHPFPTTKIILTKSQKQLGIYQGKPVLLKIYLEGTVLDNFDAPTLEKLGTVIAKLNLVPPPSYIPKQFSYGRQCFSDLIEVNPPSPFSDWLRKIDNYLALHIDPNLPQALIHGDIFFSNVIIDNNHQPTLMDFEESCHYFRIFELGMAITGLCQKKGLIDFKKAKILLQGYQKMITLSPLELEKLKPFIIYAATATAFWRYRQFNIIAPYEAYKDTYLAMQKIANQVFNSDIKKKLEI